jgi:hypothetical protein
MREQKSIEERLEIVERNQRNTAIVIIMLLFGGFCAFLGGFLVYAILRL